MKQQRCDGQRTRQKLLDAASKVFAKKGFGQVTNADICEAAMVNVASINYHFGSKENLYVESWKYSFEKSIKAHPQDVWISSKATVEERIRTKIKSLIEWISDPESYDFDIMQTELAHPTGLLVEIVESTMNSLEKEFKTFLGEFLGNNATPKKIRLCHMSIIGQCLSPELRLQQIQTKPEIPQPDDLRFDFDAQEITEHILKFTMVGIMGIHKECQENSKSEKDI